MIQVSRHLLYHVTGPLHDRVISRRGDGWAHKTSLTWPFCIQVTPYQAREVRGYVFV
jgi:hypothetical protein